MSNYDVIRIKDGDQIKFIIRGDKVFEVKEGKEVRRKDLETKDPGELRKIDINIK